MKHELIDLYNLAIHTQDKDIIKQFQEAKQRIAPAIIIDVLLENEKLENEIARLSYHCEALKEIIDNNAELLQTDYSI